MTTPSTDKDQQAEEARLAAEISSKAASRAAEQATADDLAARQAEKDDPKARLCPHCKGEMIKHGPENPFKAGAWHCNSCGCCFRGKELREGHASCLVVAAAA